MDEERITEIKVKFSQIETKQDLLCLMNEVRIIVFGEKSNPFSLKQLTYFCNPDICKVRYKEFSIKKRSGGERQINAPVQGLKSLLTVLNKIFHCCIDIHHAANGFVLKKSIVSNAMNHSRKAFVYNIDLKDFFYSFERQRVKYALMRELFESDSRKESIAFIIASLCTHPLEFDGNTKYVLPQGSPASPVLTNLLCKKLDRRLNGLAKKVGAKYTRYADDITFSSQYNVFEDIDFQKELRRIIEDDQKFKINPEKTRLQNSVYRQEVTGLIVNEKTNVPRSYVKQIRMWIYYWEKYGYFRAEQLFSKDYFKNKVQIKKSPPNLTFVLRGKLDYLKMVKGEGDSTYLSLIKRFDNLSNSRLSQNIK